MPSFNLPLFGRQNNRKTVALLVNDNGSNGSTTFLDQSTKRLNYSVLGNTAYTNAQAPSGMTTSASFDGTGDGIQLVSSVGNKNFEFGYEDFTVEFYLRYSVNASADLIDMRIGDYSQMRIRMASANDIYYDINGSALVFLDVLALNNWWHLAIGRKDGFLRYWRDGVASTLCLSERSFHKAGKLQIGGANSNVLTGWMSNIKIVKGLWLYPHSSPQNSLPLRKDN